MQPERRFAYRVSADDDGNLRAEVSGESGRAFGNVLDLSLKGAGVRIVEQDPVFAIGETVTLTVLSPMGSVQILATVRARTELDGSRRFGFEFTNPSALRAKLSSALLRLFNERESFRLEPSGEVQVDVVAPGKGFHTIGRLSDVSVDGVGFLIDGEGEKRLARVAQVTVEFTLPGQNRPVTFQALIRNRYRFDDEGTVCIGLSFDPEVSFDFVSQQRNVTGYIMARQRELLQSRVET